MLHKYWIAIAAVVMLSIPLVARHSTPPRPAVIQGDDAAPAPRDQAVLPPDDPTAGKVTMNAGLLAAAYYCPPNCICSTAKPPEYNSQVVTCSAFAQPIQGVINLSQLSVTSVASGTTMAVVVNSNRGADAPEDVASDIVYVLGLAPLSRRPAPPPPEFLPE